MADTPELIDAEQAIIDAISGWLRRHGLDTDSFERGLSTRREGDALWIDEGTPQLEVEDVVPEVLRRVGRDDPDAAGVAAFALVEGVGRFGPILSADEVDAHLDRLVRWAAGRTRQRLHLWHAPAEAHYRAGVAPRPFLVVSCSWSRPRSGRAPARRGTRRRALSRDGPARSTDDDPHEHDVADRSPVGRAA